MESRLTPSVGAAAIGPVRVEAAPVRTAVRTDLAPPKAVSAQAGAEQVRQSRDRREGGTSGGRETSSSFEVDRETGELIYKVIDQVTQSVLSQYPYEGLLKLRAYIKSADARE
ncbi:MAG: flagellar protein FlaG [Methylobacterium sp.]|nr:flagellar protein FlaG [Methylobacterium sp.]